MTHIILEIPTKNNYYYF